MSDFKEASRLKLRVDTPKGPLSVEQLWGLSLDELDTIAVSLSDHYDESGTKSFLKTRSKKDKMVKLALDVVLDVLGTKLEETEQAAKARDIKEHNQKIMSKIQEAKDKELDNLSPEQLEKLLR